MEYCLLCLRNHTEYNKYIRIESPQWLQSNILNIIEKHFWPIDKSDLLYGICQTCWSQLNDFHTFYTTIEEAQGRNIKIDIEEQTFNNLGKSSNTCNLDMEIHTIKIPMLKMESISAEELIFPNDEIAEDIKIEENTLLGMPTITVSNDMKPKTTALPKKKRGRPRKIRVISKPKRKPGRPRKYAVEKGDLHTNECTFRNGSRTIANVDKHQPTTGSTNTRNLETPLKNVRKRGRPAKKPRGRPRKVQINETIDITLRGDELPISTEVSVLNKQCPIVQLNTDCPIVNSEKLSKDESLNLDQKRTCKTKAFEYKKKKLLKNRQKIKQHKAIMRNYIATSMRCMKFLKK